MHGAGVIDGIAAEKIGGEAQSYYVFKMPVGGLVLKIPVATSSRVGLRRIVDRDEAGRLMVAIPQMDPEMTGNWNRRYRENMERLKSGDLYQVAKVIKGLAYRDSVRGLSNGERKMLHTAKQILLSELVLVTGQDYQTLEAAVNAAIQGERAR
jgi:CarD family transcriptional regulator